MPIENTINVFEEHQEIIDSSGDQHLADDDNREYYSALPEVLAQAKLDHNFTKKELNIFPSWVQNIL